jgi:hypothetical protein
MSFYVWTKPEDRVIEDIASALEAVKEVYACPLFNK